MPKELIPFYVETHRHRMGYKLFIDMKTMRIYRVYDDSYRFFEGGGYWGYHFGGYGLLTAIGGVTMNLSFIASIFVLIIMSAILFRIGDRYLYKKSYENMDLKDAFLTKDEFMDYAKAGRYNARVLIISMIVCILIFLVALRFYLASPSIGLLIVLTLDALIIGVFKAGIPARRLRLHYQGSYREEIAAGVQDELAR